MCLTHKNSFILIEYLTGYVANPFLLEIELGKRTILLTISEGAGSLSQAPGSFDRVSALAYNITQQLLPKELNRQSGSTFRYNCKEDGGKYHDPPRRFYPAWLPG